MAKKTFILSFMMIIAALSSFTQSIELTPIAGYTFRSTINITGGEARINDGFTYGGALTVNASPVNAVEISYYRYQTVAEAYSSNAGFVPFSYDVAMNYMFIGGKRNFPTPGKITGFTGLNLGAGWLASQDDTFSTITKFAMGFDAGIKIMASEKVGIRLQTNFYFPITSAGGSAYWSTGGSGATTSAFIPIWSFGFNGGLIYKIK